MTFTPLACPDFVSDRERMLISQLVPLVREFLQAADDGYGLHWRIECFDDPEAMESEAVLHLDVIGFGPIDTFESGDGWDLLESAVYRRVVRPWVETYRGSPVHEEALSLAVELHPA